MECIGGICMVWMFTDCSEGCILSFLVVQPCIEALTKTVC